MKKHEKFDLIAQSIRIFSIGFVISLAVTGSNAATCPQPKFDDNSKNDADFLKRALEALAKATYETAGKPHFVFTVCAKATADGVSDPKAGLIDKDKKVVIGQYDNATVGAPTPGNTSVVYITYGNGSPCKNNASWQGVVMVICDRTKTPGELRLLQPEHDCVSIFTLTTSYLCDLPRTTAPAPATIAPSSATTNAGDSSSKSSHMSAFTGFLLFMLAVACGYCVVGFLYKRYVLGARGAQQIPNYLFWIRVVHAIQDCVSNRPSSRYATNNTRTAEYDRANAADVQLMNDNEDFKYDQQPLNVSPGAGQATTFRQQSLTVAPNTPSVNAQRQRQQDQPLLPQEDPDERLLQV